MRRAVFLDKDGTLVENVPYNVDPELVFLASHSIDGLRLLQKLGFRLIVVTNQAGVALGRFEENRLTSVRMRIEALLGDLGITLWDFFYCPHHPEGTVTEYARHCTCRKPMPGLLVHAAAVHHLDLSESWMIGDILHDVEAGHRAGCRSILVDNGNETEWDYSNTFRIPDYKVESIDEAALAIARDAPSLFPVYH